MKTQRGWATIIGIVLLLVGLVGFWMNPVLGWFDVNNTHNVVHLLTGAIFLWAGLAKKAPVKPVNQWLGVIYILVGIVGFFGVLTFLAVNAADNWLHLVIGVVSAGIGWFAK